MKSAAKKLGKRFACGAAVSRNDAGKDEIVIQVRLVSLQMLRGSIAPGFLKFV